MKVAIVTSFPHDPLFPHGGVEAVSTNLVQGLARREGLDVQVITVDPYITHAYQEPWEGAEIHRLPYLGGNRLTNATGAGRRQIHEYVGRIAPELIHAHDTYGIMVRGLPVPRVFTIHGFIHEDTLYARERFFRLRALMWKRVEIQAWQSQPHIVSIAPYVRERLTGIYSGIIHDIENPIAAQCFAVKNVPQPGTVFCAALVCKRKNILGLVESFRTVHQTHPAARLRVAGAFSEPQYADEVRRYIENSGLSDAVTLLGSLSADQVRQELATADIFALLSFEEGAPMGVAEAMAAGVPVVCSNRCGMPYMVRDGETGFLVNPLLSNDAARALAAIIGDRALRARMSARSIEYALDRYHPDTVARRTHELYQRVLAAG